MKIKGLRKFIAFLLSLSVFIVVTALSNNSVDYMALGGGLALILGAFGVPNMAEHKNEKSNK